MGWEIRLSKSKSLPYFFNAETQESSWTTPAGLTPEQIVKLPGAELLTRGQIRASHLLVKHKDSRRPSSWKEPKITRTKEEALSILRGYQAEIANSREKFHELALAHSDCSSHSEKGDLGWFGPGQMQKAFEDAAFALQVGQISDIISTDSGVHLILRTE